MEAIKLSSEASEPLGMRSPEKHPLELQRFFFFFFFGGGGGGVSLLKKINELRSWKQ